MFRLLSLYQLLLFRFHVIGSPNILLLIKIYKKKSTFSEKKLPTSRLFKPRQNVIADCKSAFSDFGIIIYGNKSFKIASNKGKS